MRRGTGVVLGWVVLPLVVLADKADIAPAPNGVSLASQSVMMQRQEQLVVTADRLSAFLVCGLDGVPADDLYSGFGGIELDVRGGRVKVLWKANQAVPQALIEYVKKMPGGSIVDFVNTPFSRGELLEESRAIVGELQRSKSAWSRVGPRAGGRGIRIELPTVARFERNLKPADNAFLEGVRQRISKRAATPNDSSYLEVAHVESPIASSRHADYPPWYGGAEVTPGAGVACSSGFSVGNVWGKYILSAGHCFSLADGVQVTSGARLLMGATAGNGLANGGELDTVRINVSSVGARIYDGSVGTGEFSKPVKGSGSPYIGLWLCTSGAFSGARCNIVVDAIEQWIYTDGGFFFDHIVSAREQSGANASGEGDSGGPVFSLRDNNASVTAQGTMSAIDSTVSAPCTGVISINNVTRRCSSHFYYTPIKNQLTHHDVWLELTP